MRVFGRGSGEFIQELSEDWATWPPATSCDLALAYWPGPRSWQKPRL